MRTNFFWGGGVAVKNCPLHHIVSAFFPSGVPNKRVTEREGTCDKMEIADGRWQQVLPWDAPGVYCAGACSGGDEDCEANPCAARLTLELTAPGAGADAGGQQRDASLGDETLPPFPSLSIPSPSSHADRPA